MTPPDDPLLALAERCEKAKGPSFVLERDIAAAVGHPAAGASGFAQQYEGIRIPNYTVSIDAALSLVPEGGLWEVEFKVNYEADGSHKGQPATAFFAGVGMGEIPAHWEYGKSFATPALALGAAALRARASTEKQ